MPRWFPCPINLSKSTPRSQIVPLRPKTEYLFYPGDKEALSPVTFGKIGKHTWSKCSSKMCFGGFPVQWICLNQLPGPKLCLLGQKLNTFSTPVIKKLYPRWYLEKLVAPTEVERFEHCPRISDEFHDGYTISDFSSNTLKLTWVPWKLPSFL